ncbi:MAG: hypothetical protein ACRDDY_04735 [Clostridium sp.]|uniref:hypothetical protein n=1 Tax=Clostridium sp. TaxID=1506 RepID=UPI003EE7A257
MKKQETRIELTTQSFTDLMNLGGHAIVDLKHVPFNDFTMVLPSITTDRMTDEKLEENFEKFEKITGGNMTKKEKDEFLASVREGMFNSRCTIDVNIDDNIITLQESGTWTLQVTFNDIEFDLDDYENYSDAFKDISFKADNKQLEESFGENEEFTLVIMRNISLALGTISFLQSDKIDTVKSISKLNMIPSKKKGKKQSKTYIYKKRYILDDNSVGYISRDVETRQYDRKTESWFSRGHWRTLKDGTKTWVKSSIKKAKEAVSNVAKEYKITKVR